MLDQEAYKDLKQNKTIYGVLYWWHEVVNIVMDCIENNTIQKQTKEQNKIPAKEIINRWSRMDKCKPYQKHTSSEIFYSI